MFLYVRKENHCLQDVCHDMTERTLLNLIFTEEILTLIFSFEGCNVCKVQYTFKRLNKMHRNVKVGIGLALTINILHN